MFNLVNEGAAMELRLAESTYTLFRLNSFVTKAFKVWGCLPLVAARISDPVSISSPPSLFPAFILYLYSPPLPLFSPSQPSSLFPVCAALRPPCGHSIRPRDAGLRGQRGVGQGRHFRRRKAGGRRRGRHRWSRNGDDDADARLYALMAICQKYLDAISESVDRVPASIRHLIFKLQVRACVSLCVCVRV